MKRIILVFVYWIFKSWVWILYHLFHSKTTISNPALFKTKTPLVLLSNHPNTLVDPLNTALQVPYIVHFLAKSSLFSPGIGNWFFSTFFCIPIERPQDNNGKRIDNKQAFKRSNQFLLDGGCLYIAPEGDSYWERKIRKVKTGAARIALHAADSSNFEKDVLILPVGLNYESPNRFQRQLLLNTGPVLNAKDYKKEYLENSHETVKKLTADIAQNLQDSVIHIPEDELEPIYIQIDRLQEPVLKSKIQDRFIARKELVKKLQSLSVTEIENVKNRISNIKTSISKYDSDYLLDAIIHPKSWVILIGLFLVGLFMLPIILLGLVFNLIPYLVVKTILGSIDLYIGYHSTFKMMIGTFVFALFYIVAFLLFKSELANGWIKLLLIVSMIPSGIISYRLIRSIKKWWAQITVKFNTKANLDSFLNERTELLELVKAK